MERNVCGFKNLFVVIQHSEMHYQFIIRGSIPGPACGSSVHVLLDNTFSYFFKSAVVYKMNQVDWRVFKTEIGYLHAT